jgi:hypothetical protein
MFNRHLPFCFYYFIHAHNLLMEDSKTQTEGLSEKISAYIETYLKLLGVTATKRATGIASLGIVSVLILALFIFIFFFLGMGAALWIGESMNNQKAGYFIVGGFFILCMFIILIFRKELIFPFVRNFLIRKIYE